MSFSLPLPGSKARELMGDMATIAEQLNPANAAKLLVTWEALRSARKMFEGEGLKPSRVCFVILRADSDERWLISIGPRGGWRKEWNFGSGKPAPVYVKPADSWAVDEKFLEPED